MNFTSFSLVDYQYQITNHCSLVYTITGEATLSAPQYSHYSKGNENQPDTARRGLYVPFLFNHVNLTFDINQNFLNILLSHTAH